MDDTAASSTVPAFATTLPIFDRLANVYGYELDFRSGFEAEFTAVAAGDEVDIDLWEAMGLDEILGLGRAHVAFGRDLVLKGVPLLLPPETLVVGVPGEAGDDDALIDACTDLRDAGYELAMDEFHPDQLDSPLLEPGDIVCVDATVVDEQEQRALCEDLPKRGVRPLARNVDTPERYQRAHEAGYWYFQGDFFRRPVIQPGKEIQTAKAHYLALLQQVNRPELEYDGLEGIIQQDVAMTYGLLRFINSVWFGLKCTVSSIRHALVLLGPREVKLWASMLVLRQMGEGKPKELFRRCLIRAKMAEAMAPRVGLGRQAGELFLMGMLSLVDALTDVPLARVLEGLRISEGIKTALLSKAGPFGLLHQTVEAYELGRWEAFAEAAAALQLNENAAPALMGTARQWADNALSSM